MNVLDKRIMLIFLLIFFGSLVQAQTVIFQDNFNDGSITDWDTNAGSWNANNFDLNGGFLDGAIISHDANMSGFTSYTITYNQRPITAGTNGEFFFFTDKNGLANMNGYELLLQSATTLFRRRTNGTSTNLFTSSGVSVGTYHSVEITVVGSTFFVKVDGIQIGTATDSTYTSGSKIAISTENGAGNHTWDDLLITGTNSSIATVTILRPIDEATGITIQEPWSVTATGAIVDFIDNNANSKSFLMPMNSIPTNFLVDDSNTIGDNYFARNYVAVFKPTDSNTLSIQPYLINSVDGLLVNVRVVDIPTNITVPNIRIILRGAVAGTQAVVEDRITDISGIAQLAMLPQKNYDFNVTSILLDINYLNGTLVAHDDVVTFLINFSSTDSNFNPKNIRYSIAPRTELVSGVSQKFDVNVSVDFNFSGFVVQAIDGNRVVLANSSSSNPFNSSLTVNLVDFNSGQVIIRTIVVGLDQNTIINKTYTISSIGKGGVLNLVNLRNNQSPNAMLLFLVVALIGLTVVVGPAIGANADSQVFIGAIGMGIIIYLFFQEFFLYAIGAMLAGAIAWMWVRVNR